jgi:RNA polymerase sigma-70 factor (ECF subfamily)
MDHELLGRLLDDHAAALELYARQWCHSPEDVVQEAFLKLAGLHMPPENPAAWLFRVVRNGAIDAGQSARRRQRYEQAVAVESTPWFEDEAEAKPSSVDPKQAAEALQSLPLEEREVIIAHLWGGLTFEQAAAVAGCSSSTAHRLYVRGLSILRERLGVSCRKSRPIPN